MLMPTRDKDYLLLANLGLANPESPYASLGTPELGEHFGIVLLEVFMNDDFDARVSSILGHLNRSPAEDGDLSDVFHLDHSVQNPGPSKAGGAGEDEVHF